MMDIEIPLAALLGVTVQNVAAMNQPPLRFAAPLPSATPEVQEEPALGQVSIDKLNENEARQVRDMLRKFEAMWDGSFGKNKTVQQNIDLTRTPVSS